ncbi:hypothetical protein B0O99DRAFT_690538 [Bisporella sp. PMI_857]|nr:hypothetical protein B0O99DRAFT_690538 [Bisporella sp. PMI_857]
MKGLHTATRCSGFVQICCLRGAPARAFSTSPRVQGNGIPKFPPTSSSELDEILSQIRTRVLLPAHLSKSQQRLIFSPKNTARLQSEPAYITISGEQFRLEPLDRTKDLPKSLGSLNRAIDLMSDRKDWENFPLLVRGYVDTKHEIKPGMAARWITQARKAGCMDIIFECVRRGTVYNLRTLSQGRAVVSGLQTQAFESGWAEATTKKSLSWAEQLLEMVEEEKHRPSSMEEDIRKDPIVIGTILELAAIRASTHLNGADAGGKVALYARKLLKILGPKTIARADNEKSEQFLKRTVPVVHGIQVAQTVLGPDSTITTQLKAAANDLDNVVHTEAKRAQEDLRKEKRNPGRVYGIRFYNELGFAETTSSQVNV